MWLIYIILHHTSGISIWPDYSSSLHPFLIQSPLSPSLFLSFRLLNPIITETHAFLYTHAHIDFTYIHTLIAYKHASRYEAQWFRIRLCRHRWWQWWIRSCQTCRELWKESRDHRADWPSWRDVCECWLCTKEGKSLTSLTPVSPSFFSVNREIYANINQTKSS